MESSSHIILISVAGWRHQPLSKYLRGDYTPSLTRCISQNSPVPIDSLATQWGWYFCSARTTTATTSCSLPSCPSPRGNGVGCMPGSLCSVPGLYGSPCKQGPWLFQSVFASWGKLAALLKETPSSSPCSWGPQAELGFYGSFKGTRWRSSVTLTAAAVSAQHLRCHHEKHTLYGGENIPT